MFRHYCIFLFFISCILSGICYAQNVIIKGKVDLVYLSDARTIYAYTHDDYISYKEKEIANCKFDTIGNFNLSFSVSEPIHIFLTIDNAKAEMDVEPDKTYYVNILAKDSDAVNTLSIAVPVEIEFLNSHDSELNFLIADFTGRYEAFLEYHRPLIAKKNSDIFGKIDTMKILCMKKYSPYNNAYLNGYISYTFASLEESIALKGNEKVFADYIKDKPIRLNNYYYMSFFTRFYSATASNFMNMTKTQNEIGKQNFLSLMEHFRQNKFLGNDTIREAVILKSLAEYFRYPEYKVNSVLSLLEQASVLCKSDVNRRSAENLKRKLSVMNAGKPAPVFSFLDTDGKSVSLYDFKGKYVYLNFWTIWCLSCTQEIMLIPELKKMYSGKIAFVSVSLDKNEETMKDFLKKNPKLDWNFLYCDNYKRVKEEFNVLAVPAYYLIDPKGNVFKAPAPNPINIEPLFIRIKKKQ